MVQYAFRTNLARCIIAPWTCVEETSVRVKAILNPRADRGRALDLRGSVEGWIGDWAETDVALTAVPNDAQEIAETAAQDGYDLVLAVGGDGTVNEVANGLLRLDSAKRIPLGIVPVGSGNDYAFGLGLPTRPEQAVARIRGGQARWLDAAHVVDNHRRSRYALNGIGIGFDAAVAVESLKIRRVYGFAAYLLAALRTIAFRYQTPHLTLAFDDVRLSQRALLLAVGVGPRVGGGFRLTPDASFTDGLVDSCLVNPVGRFTMLYMLLRVMRGTHITSPVVSMRRSSRIRLQSNLPLPIHIDGEIFARVEDKVNGLTITTHPAALPVVL